MLPVVEPSVFLGSQMLWLPSKEGSSKDCYRSCLCQILNNSKDKQINNHADEQIIKIKNRMANALDANNCQDFCRVRNFGPSVGLCSGGTKLKIE